VAAAFARVDYAEIIRMLDRDLGGTSYSLGSLFRDEQRRVLKRVLREILTETEEAYARIYQQHLPLMRFLSHLGVPLPRAYQTAAEFVFNNGLREAYTAEPPDFARARALAAEAGEWDVPLDRADHAYRLARVLSRLARRWEEAPADLELLGALRDGVEAALALPFEVDLWDVQNRYFGLLRSFFPRFEAVAAEGPPGSLAWLGQFVSLGEMLGIEVSAMKETLAELGRAPLVADLVREFTLRRHVPRATYRLQFHKDFPFSEAEALAGYLAGLGVSDCYASPVLCSRPGSPHGYDIIDHARIAPDLGGEEGFYSLADALHREGLCLILDTVPNHMGIDHPDNRWWMDVLENGPSARHAGYFDIDWDPVNPDLTNKVLLPVLGDQYGAELEAGRFRLHYDDGAFRLTYYDHVFPIAPGTNALILEKALEGVVRALGPGHEDAVELESILTALQYLPPRTGLTPEKIAERYREKEVIRRRVRDLVNRSPAVREAVGRSVALFNGRPGDPASFDLLDRLIDGQPYRPAFWRVAMEEINYRRFFDINDLAAIRVERPEVFRATHELFLGLIGEGRADGLRIDHPDGLWNPTHYFRDLQLGALVAKLMRRLPPQREAAQVRQEAAEALEALRREAGDGPPPRPLYVVAEKILSEGEQLPEHWAVDGTTGYDFLNLLNGLFVAGRNEEAFDVIYREFAGPPPDFRQLVNSTKKMIMLISMASEINSLSHQLDRIAERNRQYRDFTLNSLTFALREVVACLPVYRTYITSPEDVTLRDRLLVENTIEEAKQRNPRTFESVFDFIGDTLLLRNLDRFPEGDRPMLIDRVMRFQQVTGPVMAKGVEDTAFYIYNRLVSLNEVGGHPVHFGVSLEAFHEQTAERLRRWPHSMLASSTHDTKRSEDVRARLNVLSEIPEEWREALFSWSQINAPRLTTLDDQLAPAANDQYLLYQTLVGAWPPGEMTREEFAEFRRRISDYMLKAVKEAKARTSWVNPVEEYDQAVADFVAKLLPDEREGDAFLTHFLPFQKRVAFFGYFNSLAQVLLKVASPGVPDFYQG
ncbi:MAG TPA: malto-oligosyltrehalose synthase, partial [Gemmataceae bacterium]